MVLRLYGSCFPWTIWSARYGFYLKVQKHMGIKKLRQYDGCNTEIIQ